MSQHLTLGRVIWVVCTAFLIFAVAHSVVNAADTEGVLSGNNVVTSMSYGGLGTFDESMQTITKGFIGTAQTIAVIMTAVAGIMVAFGLGEANRFFWNWILGIGLVINFGSVIISFWNPDSTDFALQTASGTSQDIPSELTQINSKGSSDGGGSDYLSKFMKYYTTQIILPGADAIVPIAGRLLIVFTVIEGTVKIALDLIEGNKVQYLVQLFLKNGFYLFLILNWLKGMDLMQALGQGFQEIGFLAGGNAEFASASSAATGADAAADNTMGLRADSIVDNGIRMFNAVWKESSMSIFAPITSLGTLICLVVAVAAIFLTALEMFMARLEFYTMALLTIPLIPFAAISQLKFLFDKALGAMINLSIKVCVIAFIQAFATKILGDYVKALEESTEDAVGNFSLLFQVILVALIIYFLVKKIPDLVQGLLSGSPSLGGASMMQTAKSAMSSAASAASKVGSLAGGVGMAAGVVAGAAAAAGGGGGGGGPGPMSAMTNSAPASLSSGSSTSADSSPKGGLSDSLKKKAAGTAGEAAGSAAGEAAGNALGGPIGGAVGNVVGGKLGEKAGENLAEKPEGKGGAEGEGGSGGPDGGGGKSGGGSRLRNSTLGNLAQAGWNAIKTRNPVYAGYQRGVNAMGGENGLLSNPYRVRGVRETPKDILNDLRSQKTQQNQDDKNKKNKNDDKK